MEVQNQPLAPNWRNIFLTAVRLLSFRATTEELLGLGSRHLAFGLLCTWIVGIGRYWDNPRVGLLQHLGIGSVVYLFVLSLFLWLLIWPLRARNWSYFRVLTFVSLVSPPAILYAIPVGNLTSLSAANNINLFFLGVVAIWRVALLVFFLNRVAQMGWLSTTIATLLPLSAIVVVLSALNLEHVVFNLMAGVVPRSQNDHSYAVVLFLAFLSLFLFIPLLISYIALVSRNLLLRNAREESKDAI